MITKTQQQQVDTTVDAKTIVRTYVYAKIQDSISMNTVDEPFITVNDEEIQFEQLDAALVSVFGVYHDTIDTSTSPSTIVRTFAQRKLEEDQQYCDANECIHVVNNEELTHTEIDAAITTVFESHRNTST